MPPRWLGCLGSRRAVRKPVGVVMAAAEAEVVRLRAEADQLRADRDELRALVLSMSAVLDLAERNALKAGYLAALDAYADGWRDGVERGARIADAEFRPIAKRLSDEPTVAELELRRWGPGGRGHFGDPRPGDRTGAGLRAAAYASWGLNRAECLERWPHLRGIEIPGAGEWS